jgi:hypothetical protein
VKAAKNCLFCSRVPVGRVGRCLFSAKGAAVISSLGQRPRVSGDGKSSALKARFFRARTGAELTANRGIESRFQRFFAIQSKSWGVAPGWHERAPLALNP